MGALIGIEGERPATQRVWVCVDGQAPGAWVQANLLDEPADAPGPAELRLSFAEPFPYDAFKVAVWGDHGGTRVARPSPHVPHKSHQQAHADLASRTRPAAVPERERIRFFLGIDASEGTHGAGPDGEDSRGPRSPNPPSLIEAYRAEQALRDRIAPLSWLTISAISLLLALALAFVVATRLEVVRWLGSFPFLGR
jgi:hypothetical protein